MEMSIRPRRLRGSEVLRKMVRETRMDKSSLHRIKRKNSQKAGGTVIWK